jgi:hypothetical protein
MSEFLMLFRGSDGRSLQPSPEQAQAHTQRWADWIGGLAQQGKMLSAQPLSAKGKTVTGTKMVITDGPYLEGKELVGGYLMLKVDSFEEAVEIAKQCPILEFEMGSVEIRAIEAMMM